MLIAVIDHNNLARKLSLSSSVDLKYHKAYSKRSEHWSPQGTKEDKTHAFWPLVSRMLKTALLISRSFAKFCYFKNTTPTIAMKPVPKTNDVVENTFIF